MDILQSSDEPNLKPPVETPSQERRQRPDRREADRSGKYDRRRNRCVHCRFFSVQAGKAEGICTYHHMPMSAHAFVCTAFKPLLEESDERT